MKRQQALIAHVITLDGPGGAGKGTLASILANRLGWALLDSGTLYRLVAMIALRRQWDPTAAADCEKAEQMAATLDPVFLPDLGEGQRVLLAGEDVTDAIRSQEVSDVASQWAVQPAIRQALLGRQRALAVMPGLIADGRDMGTVIFPDAELKLYITASAAERANRRFAQLSAQGVAANLDQIYREIVERDTRDASREAAPLKPALDAHIIDTTGHNVATSSQTICDLVAAKGWLAE